MLFLLIPCPSKKLIATRRQLQHGIFFYQFTCFLIISIKSIIRHKYLFAFLFLIIVPFWTNSLIRTYALKAVLGTKGLLNQSLLALGLIDQPLRIVFTEAAVIIGLVYILLPFMILPLYAAIEKLDGRLLEAARDLGAGALPRFVRIVLPLTMPGIIAGCLLVFLPAMGMFYISDLLGGAKNLLIGNIIKSQFLTIRDWPFGAATSVALTLMMALLLLVYYHTGKLLNRRENINEMA